MLCKFAQTTFAISSSPANLPVHWIQSDRKELLAFQQIDNTFPQKGLAIALWYPMAPVRVNLTGVKRMLGVLSRNSLTLRRIVIQLVEWAGATPRFLKGLREDFTFGREEQGTKRL
jgi:hypothetical protein